MTEQIIDCNHQKQFRNCNNVVSTEDGLIILPELMAIVIYGGCFGSVREMIDCLSRPWHGT